MEGKQPINNLTQKEVRLYYGEAYMHCNECGARLYSFDGDSDLDKPCPYVKDKQGKCTDKLRK